MSKKKNVKFACKVCGKKVTADHTSYGEPVPCSEAVEVKKQAQKAVKNG